MFNKMINMFMMTVHNKHASMFNLNCVPLYKHSKMKFLCHNLISHQLLYKAVTWMLQCNLGLLQIE